MIRRFQSSKIGINSSNRIFQPDPHHTLHQLQLVVRFHLEVMVEDKAVLHLNMPWEEALSTCRIFNHQRKLSLPRTTSNQLKI